MVGAVLLLIRTPLYVAPGAILSPHSTVYVTDGMRFLFPEHCEHHTHHPSTPPIPSGSIVRVGMLNFLTYDECEVFPGPKLNVVLGPNGTGKSTITHAICLACAGKPETLGRSPDLKQFVKHGKEECEAFCEVDILTKEWGAPSVLTVRRYINSKTRGSTYSLNFEHSTEKAVKLKMRELNVDVDNLCCFMAQDKVGNFTRLNAKGIMEQTLQNILSEEDSERTLYDVQQDLNDIEKNKQNKGREVNAKREQLQTCDMLINGMQGEVDAMRRQDQYRTQLEKYHLHRVIIETQELKKSVEQKQVLVDEAEASLQTAQASISPLEVEERNLRLMAEKQEKARGGGTERLKKADAIVQSNRAKIEATDVQLSISSENIHNLDAQRASKQRQLLKTQQEEMQKQRDLVRISALADSAQENLKALKTEQLEVEKVKEEADERAHGLETLIDEKRHVEQRLRARQNNVRDPHQQYRQELEKNQSQWKHEVKAMEHIRNNPGDFKQKVIGPLGMCISAKDPDVASLINLQLLADVNAFIVQNDADQELLRRVAPTCRIYTVKREDVEPFRCPYSRHQLDSLQGFGFQGFIRDYIECDPMVMTYLCSFHKPLLMTLYAKTADKRNFTDEHSNILAPGGQGPKIYKLLLRAGRPQDSGPRFKADFFQYSGSFSRYNEKQGRTVSSKALDPYGRPQFVTVTGQNGSAFTEERLAIDEELERNTSERAKSEQAHRKVSEEAKHAQMRLNEISKKTSTFKSALREPALLQKHLQKLQETIKNIQSDLEKDTRNQKTKLVAAYQAQLIEIREYADVMIKRSEDCVKLQVDAAADAEQRAAVEAALQEVRVALDAARDGLKDLRRQKEETLASRNAVQQKYKDAVDRLKELAKEHGGDKAFTLKYQSFRNELEEKTLAEIDARIATLEHLISQAVDNPRVLQIYEERLAEKAALEASLQQLEGELRQHEATVQLSSSKWLEQVNNVIEKIGRKFETYMKKLQYNGEVHLHKIGTIAEYEMRLSVSYKAEQELSELDGFKQSGGERAVATIMYLMALQELSRAPFRAVDEINQGMDERNERLVFDQIVQSSTSTESRRSHQYFLISPKLLQGLRSMEHPDVTVLMVWNGIGVDKHKWQIGDILRKLRAKRAQSDISKTAAQDAETEDEEEEEVAPRPRKKVR